MPINLRHRSFVKELDFSPEELRFLLKLSADLKTAKYGGFEQQRLRGKNIALIFEKTSTRTRCAFEVAAYDQGAHVTYLGPEGSQIGHKESIKDTARVLGRMFDGIEYRGFAQETVEILARHRDWICLSASAAIWLTASSGSDSAFVSAGAASRANDPNEPNAAAAARRTSTCVSCKRSISVGIVSVGAG